MGVSSMPMETSVILHNIQRMVQVTPVPHPQGDLGPLLGNPADLISFIGRKTSV